MLELSPQLARTLLFVQLFTQKCPEVMFGQGFIMGRKMKLLSLCQWVMKKGWVIASQIQLVIALIMHQMGDILVSK